MIRGAIRGMAPQTRRNASWRFALRRQRSQVRLLSGAPIISAEILGFQPVQNTHGLAHRGQSRMYRDGTGHPIRGRVGESVLNAFTLIPSIPVQGSAT